MFVPVIGAVVCAILIAFRVATGHWQAPTIAGVLLAGILVIYAFLKPKPIGGLSLPSRAVIGVTREDRRGAVELLGQDDAGEPMRQSHRPERELEAARQRRSPWPSGPPISIASALDAAVAFLGEELRRRPRWSYARPATSSAIS